MNSFQAGMFFLGYIYAYAALVAIIAAPIYVISKKFF